jgi:mono/diheme cytochrome c family protein
MSRRSLAAAAAAVLLVGGAAGYAMQSQSRSGDGLFASFLPAKSAVAAGVFDFEFTDVDGATSWLSELREHEAVVVVMRDTGCPVSQKYGPRIARMEEEYGARGVAFVYLNVNAADTPEAVRAEIERLGLRGRYVHDVEGRLGRVLAPRSTGEVLVFDAQRTLLFRGGIDDQYGVGYTKPEPTQNHLRDALDRVLAGQKPAAAQADAPGCLLGFEQHAAIRNPVTYTQHVGRIVQTNCVSCHTQGGLAPFPLETYEQVHARRHMIAYMVRSGRMPPWGAHRSVGSFANDRSLSDEEIYALLRWVDNGAPQGQARHLAKAAPRADDSGWLIGEPDAVVAMPEEFHIPAEGIIDYQYFYVKTDFPEDRWITKMEFRPSAKQQVHHALVFIEDPDAERKQGGTHGFFAGYAPGYPGMTFPEGSAKLLPKGAWLKFQMHYTANGTAAVDRTELGFVFAKEPPTHEVHTRSAINWEFVIPPHAENHEVLAEHTFRQTGTVLSLFPHMHVRGKAFRVDLVDLDGSITPLLWVPRYDFNWQLAYQLKEPVHVEPGMKLRATGWFDNSRRNPYNPDPEQTVVFGEQSFDEMMIGYFDWIPAPAPAAVTAR